MRSAAGRDVSIWALTRVAHAWRSGLGIALSVRSYGEVPTSLDQEVGEGLGAQAGETKLTEVVRDGGFTRVRRATAGPFNMVPEARA
jgi:hypothetical protein